jgi:serine/threonine protein kinase
MSQMCPTCSFDNASEAKNCAQCSKPLRNLLGAGVQLSGRYQLESVLGCGAMGAVYLATDQRLVGRRCAIKENRPNPDAPVNVQEQTRAQFLAEASILARLDHPNLPKVSDYFIENEREYLVMDYVEGEDLESRMLRTKEPLPETEVIDWADQTLDALAYLHNQLPQPIIHRDIKPANLRIDLYNRVKLVDFGLVKLFDADSPETKAELRGVGTPAYAPLEQFAGSEDHTDNRSDIYSLGATIYHLLTHLPPVEVHRRVLKPQILVLPSQLNKNLSEHTEQVILRAIEIHPDDRFQTAEEMRQALKIPAQVAEAPPPLNTTSFPKKPAQDSGPSNTFWVLAGIGVVVVLLILGGMAWTLFGGESGQPAPTEQQPVAQQPAGAASPTASPAPTSTATPQPTLVVAQATATPENDSQPTPLPPTMTATATITPTATAGTPSQSQPVVESSIPADALAGSIAYPVFNGSSYDLYIGQADGSGTTLFQEQASQPAFSPDGSRIAFHSWRIDQRGLVTMDMGSANQTLVTNFIEDQLPTWSADGSQIVLLTRRSGSRKSELLKVNSNIEIDTGVLLGEGEYPTIGLSGELLFRAWGSTGAGLRLSDVNLGDLQTVTDSEQDTAPALSPDGQQVVFMSRRAGNWEIYVANRDGSDLQRLTENPADDGLPTWSPDGRVVAFLSNRDGQWGMWAMTPTGADPRLLFEIQGSPDGFVGDDTYASRGWAEERISWTP